MRDPKISLITSPDTLFNDSASVLVINPNNTIKENLNEVLKHIKDDLNLYLYEEDAHNDIEWLLTVSKTVDWIVINVDDCEKIKWLIGSFLTMNKTFYLTNEEQYQYNIVNTNRIYDLHQFAEGVNYFEK